MNRCERCGGAIDINNMIIDDGRTYHMFCHSVTQEEIKRADKMKSLAGHPIKTYGDLVKFFGRVLPNLQINDILGYSQPLLPPEAPNP